MKYKITVKSSDEYADAGTKSKIKMIFIGQDGISTAEFILKDFYFGAQFYRNSVFTTTENLVDIGMPSIIKIEMINFIGREDEWLCEYIEVTRGDEIKRFPVYSYIIDNLEVSGGTATLPQNEKQIHMVRLRLSEVERNKVDIRWEEVSSTEPSGYPRYIKAALTTDLPRILQMTSRRVDEFTKKRDFASTLSLMFGLLKGLVFPVDSFESYHKLSEHLPATSNFHEGWQTDEVQGWQMLNGMHPLAYELCKEIPSYFNVTDDDLVRVLDGKTIAEMIKEEKLYISDFSELYGSDSGIVYRPSTFGTPASCPPSVCLFVYDRNEVFRPVAIQLKRNDRDYLFTCDQLDTEPQDWLLAKMYYRCSVSNHAAWIVHYLNTHAVMEPICIALFRCLPRCHPVYKLLRPHVRAVAAINTSGRIEILGSKAKAINAFACQPAAAAIEGYKTFRFDDLNIPKVLEKRGIKPGSMKNNWYGRDTLKIWKIIQDYVTSVLKQFYTTDEDITGDFELQDWAKELAMGFSWEDNDKRGAPDHFDNVDQLIELCTVVIGTSSAQHAAVNFGTLDTYRFPPAAPTTMNLEPHKRGEANMERILTSLPTSGQVQVVAAINATLSMFSEDDVYLGDWSEMWYNGEKALAAQMKMKSDCEAFHDEVVLRNESLERKYTYLDPRQVPSNIAI